VHGQPRGYNVLNLNSLASAIKKTANPADNETLNPETNEFIDQDSAVNMVKSLTKIQEAGPQEHTWFVNRGQPVVHHVQQAIGG